MPPAGPSALSIILKTIPIMIIEIPKIVSFLGFVFFSSTFIKEAVSTGLMTNATNNEEPNTVINVIGNQNINSPIIPGQTAKGRNAANVVAVEAIMGIATSPTPYLAASKADMPSSSIRR